MEQKRPLNVVEDIYKNAPNPYCCEGCPDWDDINGCWAGVEDYRDCPRIDPDACCYIDPDLGELPDDEGRW